MNKQQRDYAMKRIETIYLARRSAIEAKHTKPGTELSDEERLAAFKKGAFKVKPGVTEICSYTMVIHLVAFNGESSTTVDKKAVDKETSALTAEYNRIRDELMLGDSDKALALIKKFEG